MDSQNIRIRLKAFDHRILDQSTSEIVQILLEELVLKYVGLYLCLHL